MALKSVDDGGFDDEISSTKIAYFAKNFRNFLRNNNRRARNQNNVDTKNVKKNETTKNNSSKNQKIRLFNPLTILQVNSVLVVRVMVILGHNVLLTRDLWERL